MTKSERNPNAELQRARRSARYRHSTFGFRASFGFRHSSFVIFSMLFPKRPFNNLGLLLLMAAVRAARRRGGRGASDARKGPVKQTLSELDPQVNPRAHVRRLFLHPNDRRAFLVARERYFQQIAPQRIK